MSLNPEFSSLNLAQAVLLVGRMVPSGFNSELSTIEEREYFYKRLEKHLDEAGFLYPEELAPKICRNLRAMFNKATLTNQRLGHCTDSDCLE